MLVRVQKVATANHIAVKNAVRFIKGFGDKAPHFRATRIADGAVQVLDLLPEAVSQLRAIPHLVTVTEAVEPTTVQPINANHEENMTTTIHPADELAVLRKLLGGTGVTEERVLDLIRANAGRPAQVNLDLRTHSLTIEHKAKLIHHKQPLLAAGVAAGVNMMIVGPAGSGKTTAAKICADMLGLDFYGTGAINSEYKLTGFIDAQGRIVNTAFRKAFEYGGLFLFDEIDASLPGAVLPFNAALANDWMDFPDANVKRHPNFRVIAGANTFGTGADRQYVGRNQLDAASLDRFAMLDWGYDEALEAALVGAPVPPSAPAPRSIAPLDADQLQAKAASWFARVLAARKAVSDLKVRHVVSPRATQSGVALLGAGWSWSEVEEAVLWKGLDADTKSKVIAKA